MLVLGVGAGAVNSQSIQHRNTKGGDEVSIGSSTDRALADVKSDLGGQAPGLFEQRLNGIGAHEGRPVNSAGNLDAHSVEDRLELCQRPGDPGPFFQGLISHIDAGAGLSGDDTGENPAADHAYIQSRAALVVAHRIDGEDLMGQLGYGANAAKRIIPGVGGLAGYY